MWNSRVELSEKGDTTKEVICNFVYFILEPPCIIKTKIDNETTKSKSKKYAATCSCHYEFTTQIVTR